MSGTTTPRLRMPGAWIDSPPSFTPPQHPPAGPSAMQPSEPTRRTLRPDRAEKIEFYYDLIKGFSDMVLHRYRTEYLPKLKQEEGRPGMFLLKQGPSGEFLETKLDEEALKADPYSFDARNLLRPTAVLNVDFSVSACSDYVPPPPPPERKIAIPVSRIGRSYRGYASSLKTLNIRPCDQTPSPPRRQPSPRSDVSYPRPSQEELHADHQCIDVERLAREYMWWFLEWRAAIPRHIQGDLQECLSATVQNYTRGNYGWAERQSEPEYKQCLNNLIWELKNPRASRPGQINPNGTPLQHPWMHGNELIHSILGFKDSYEDTVSIHLKTMLRYAHVMRHEANPRTPRAPPTLWDILSRTAAPLVDGKIRDDGLLALLNGKRLQETEMQRYGEARKRRRLRFDGSEKSEPDALEENAAPEDGGLTDVERDKLITELEAMRKANQNLQAENQNLQDRNNTLRSNYRSLDKTAKAAEDQVKELQDQQRIQQWVAQQGQSSYDSDQHDELDEEDKQDKMDIDD